MSKKKKTDIIKKMSIIGIIGLVIILIIIVSLFFSIRGKNNKSKSKNKLNSEIETDVDNNLNNVKYERALAVIRKVDEENNKLMIFNIEDNKEILLNIDSAVDIKDEYGTLMTFIQFNVGDLVETKYDANKLRPEFIHKTAKTWERKKVKGVIIDSENSKLLIGNDAYIYTNELITIFNGKSFDIKDLNIEDEVTLRGYKDKVWTVTLENGHGYIVFKNHSNFVGGLVEIGLNKTEDIKEVTKIAVPVGVHNIVATKDTLTYETEIMVDKDQEVIVDLGKAAPRTGMVQFNIVQDNIAFTINGKTYNDFSEPINLEYGTYNIKIVKENYINWEKQLVVDKPFVEFDINLEKKPMYIHINTPEGADVYIDGNFIGVVPTTTPIDKGDHTITLRKDGYYSKMHQLSVEDKGEDYYLTFPTLEKINKETENKENNNDKSNNSQEIINPNPIDNNDEIDDEDSESTPSSDVYKNNL
jgi:hypothetical protein